MYKIIKLYFFLIFSKTFNVYGFFVSFCWEREVFFWPLLEIVFCASANKINLFEGFRWLDISFFFVLKYKSFSKAQRKKQFIWKEKTWTKHMCRVLLCGEWNRKSVGRDTSVANRTILLKNVAEPVSFRSAPGVKVTFRIASLRFVHASKQTPFCSGYFVQVVEKEKKNFRKQNVNYIPLVFL